MKVQSRSIQVGPSLLANFDRLLHVEGASFDQSPPHFRFQLSNFGHAHHAGLPFADVLGAKLSLRELRVAPTTSSIDLVQVI